MTVLHVSISLKTHYNADSLHNHISCVCLKSLNREKSRSYSEENQLVLSWPEVAETAARELNPCDKPPVLRSRLALPDEIAREPDATAGNIIFVFQI